MIQYTDQKFTDSYSVHVPNFSALSGGHSKREEPLDKAHHLLSGTVVLLVAWEPGCVFSSSPWRESSSQIGGSTESHHSPLVPAYSWRYWLLLASAVLPRPDQAVCSGVCG